mgnify:CR=1 FL=1
MSKDTVLFLPRNRDFLVVPNSKPDEMGRIMVFMPDGIISGDIILLHPDEIEPLGEN